MKDVSEFELEITPSRGRHNFLLFSMLWVLEHVILFRWPYTGYERYPKANLRLISTLVQTAIVFGTVFYGGGRIVSGWAPEKSVQTTVLASSAADGSVGTQPNSKAVEDRWTLIIGFVSVWGVLWWNERSSLYDKWKYLAGLYNSYVVEDSNKKVDSGSSQSGRSREILRTSLALDLIDMGMWNHNSYSTIFKQVLVRALAFNNRQRNFIRIQVKREISESVTTIVMSADEVRRVLQQYQHHLLPALDLPDDMDFIDSSVA